MDQHHASQGQLTACVYQDMEPSLHLAPFRFDVTPPVGHSLCGGWIRSVAAVDDLLEAIGFVMFGVGEPIVICAVDWTGILNEAHSAWRCALAQAAQTTPDRVAVQCVHQHNAPLACVEAERIVGGLEDLPHVVDLDFFSRCLDCSQKAIAEGLQRAQPITHIAHGEGIVEKVASNRRIHRNETGQIIANRDSNGPAPELRAMPEGLIDPWLKTVIFCNGTKKVVACHYYATHPMSYYGDGRVSSDFAGLARKQRQEEEPDCLHVYFTGCAGNIAAGKYNDGSEGMRSILTQRLYEGIVRSEENLQSVSLTNVSWRTAEILPRPRNTLSADSLQKQIDDKGNSIAHRNRSSFMLSWLRRVERSLPVVISALHLNDTSLLHLPGECFIEYQLRAQKMQPSRFIATAGYGDGGPWYIPVKEEYPLGGYEVSMAFCDEQIDALLTCTMQDLLAQEVVSNARMTDLS
jgi:hypothetical protein